MFRSNGDEGSKRLRSGTVVQKLKATDTPDFSHSQSPPHSQRTRLSMSLMRPPSLRNFKMDDELDNAAIEKAMHQRTVAESAELKARNDLHLARVALNDRMGQKDDADSALAKQDEDIASLLQRVEEARKERDSLHQRVIHAASHLQDAEDRVEECGRDVVTKTASSKQAQRDYAVHVRGE
jgi:chromosome segregation ATPase